MKPKRCPEWMPVGTNPTLSSGRCTLEVGHTGLHTILPPSGMDYAPDDTAQVPQVRAPETTTTGLSTEQLVAVSKQRRGPCKATLGGGEWFNFSPAEMAQEILTLRDEKMALLLVVDDAHGIMEERAEETDRLHDLRRAINEELIGADMESGDREVTLRNVRNLVGEVNEGRERIEALRAAIRHANASILDYDHAEWQVWNDLPGVRDALEVEDE